MILDLTNEIDNKISTTYPEEVIENINFESTDFFGINIDTDAEKDFAFKIYYKNTYSKELYEKNPDSPLLNWLYERDMIRFLTIVHDQNNDKLTRCDIGLKRRNNTNMKELFEWLNNNVSFFKKYKKEIVEFSKMKNTHAEDSEFNSLYFLGYVTDENYEIKTLKCHWFNRITEGNKDIFCDKHYLEYLQNCDIKEFKELVPYAKTILQNCDTHLWMEGIDYNENYSQKHKIYFQFPQNTYNGLIKTFENEILTEKLEKIRTWNEIHKEFSCDGFAIGKTHDGTMTLNLYFQIPEEEQLN